MSLKAIKTGTGGSFKIVNNTNSGGLSMLIPFPPFINAFTSAGATGRSGPTLVQCQSAYAGKSFLTSNFTVTSGIQILTISTPGTYTIIANGAGGGAKGTVADGGRGASMQGNFTFVEGDVITMLVGQKGGDVGDGGAGTGQGGGGGGSFVLKNGTLILAAGGGGGGTSYSGAGNGSNASTTTSGVSSGGGATGGTNGGGGGTGGNVLYGNGGSGYSGTGGGSGGYGTPGTPYTSGGTGGSGYQGGNGGFGGGGGGSFCGGGGGGGYSGGAGGYYTANGGGGGGSYNIGTNQVNAIMTTNTTGSITLNSL
jgi:hypothetical protein